TWPAASVTSQLISANSIDACRTYLAALASHVMCKSATSVDRGRFNHPWIKSLYGCVYGLNLLRDVGRVTPDISAARWKPRPIGGDYAGPTGRRQVVNFDEMTDLCNPRTLFE